MVRDFSSGCFIVSRLGRLEAGGENFYLLHVHANVDAVITAKGQSAK